MSRRTEPASGLDNTTRSAVSSAAPAAPAVVPCLTVLWHPELRRVGHLAPLSGLLSGKSAALSRSKPSFTPPDGTAPPGPLADPFLSRRSLRLNATGDGGVRLERRHSRTSLSVDGAPVTKELELTAAELERGVILLLADRIALVLHRMSLELERPPAFDMVGESDPMLEVRRQVVRLASHEFPVLLWGESGTGKELVAHALHRAGSRCEGPFVSVNMGALPPSLAAAELFGAVRGAYTGADRHRQGLFQQADGGTLFLDEIGEASPELQVLLLRTLESGRVRPVGAAKSQAVDVRVVAATDADLEAEATAGGFRAPLFHRLDTYEVELPPLRARREDFGRLFLHFLRQELEAVGEVGRLDDPALGGRPWIDAYLVGRFAAHPWPGNVRQLRNVVRQLIVRSQGEGELRLTPKIERLLREVPAEAFAKTGRQRYRKPSDVGEDELLEALRLNRWHVQRTASALAVSRTTLYALMDGCPSIRKASELDREELERCRETCCDDLDAMAEQLEVSKHGLRLRLSEIGIR